MRPPGPVEQWDVVVIGAGLGGLAAAGRIAAAGRRVLVLEQEPRVGGKCHVFERDGYRFDTGPSVLTLPHVLREHARACGRELEDVLALEPAEPGCRYYFPDGMCFDAPGTLEGLRAAVQRDFPAEVAGFDRYFDYARRLWSVSEPFFLTEPLDGRAVGRIRPRHLPGALALLRPGSLEAVVRSCFRDPRLIQLFLRFATYNGSDPGRTPAAFSVIAHSEFAFGSWRCRGGMYALAEALASLARGAGAEIRCDTTVAEVEWGPGGGAVAGVKLADGTRIRAAHVVVNADALTARAGPLLAGHPRARSWRRAAERSEPSSGGYVLLLALDRVHPAPALHTIVFRPDYGREFRELFEERVPLTDPTLYVSIPARAEQGLAPPGGEGWFVLVNAPARPEPEAWPAAYADKLVDSLASGPLGLERRSIRWREVLSPSDFARRFGAWRGALYGRSSNDLWAAFRRVPNAGPVRGLHFCGGSAHPGGGIPLVLWSGALAARSCLQAA